MATMLNVYDRTTRKKTAVLENAYNIVETHELNQIYTLSFTIPADDLKVSFCLPRHFVRWGETGELYRIKAPKRNDGDISVITYECEHVITTLVDSIMFGSFQYGGGTIKTADVIRWLLNQQKEQNWTLGSCDFDRKFEYLWEQENILNALYSIPKEFASPYKWTFDTTVYPWKLSLKAINPKAKPEYYLRAKSNILSSGTAADYANVCTRIYPLGYGEGVNQLNIKSVNNGVAYLQSPKTYTDKYGIVEKVLVDRRFENAESLMAYAQSMLDLYQEPSMSRTFDVTDLYPLTAQSFDDAEVGKICKMTQDETTAYITKTRRQLDKAGDLQIDLSTKATDIASNVADLADRVRIESVYAQGATQLYQHSKDANATPSKGMVMSLYFPSEMRQINKVLMRLKLNKFRSYSATTSSNGGFSQTYTISQGSQTTNTQTNTEDKTITVSAGSQTTVSQTNTKDTTITVSAGSQTTESQTNTKDTTITVSAGSQTTVSQTNTKDTTITVSAGSQTTNTQTNTQDKEITLSLSKYETTDLSKSEFTSEGGGGTTVTSEYGGETTITSKEGGGTTVTSEEGGKSTLTSERGGDMTVTSKAGGGTNTTSANIDNSTVSINTTSDPVWPYHDIYWAYTAQQTHYYDDYENHETEDSIRYYNETGNAVTDPPIPYSGGEGHYHAFYRPYHHYHQISSLTIPSLTIDLAQFSHTHTINMNNVGSHSHIFTMDSHDHNVELPYHQHVVNTENHQHTVTLSDHQHAVNLPKHRHKVTLENHKHNVDISHTHKYDISHTHTFSCPSHTHGITIPSHSHTFGCPSHTHGITIPSHSHTFGCPSHTHKITIPSHSHTFGCPSHTHKITIPAHSHTFGCPSHTHKITIPGHSHTITIPTHDHDIIAGIYESGNPTAFDIYVNGTKKTTVTSTSYEGDITSWLLNAKNQVPRDSWIDVEIRPNDLAYVVSSVFVQGFVQSRGGGNY